VTFSLPHIANRDAELMGYRIPKDTIVIANLYSAHIDPKYWPAPEKFRPERFLGDDGRVLRKDGLVPFGDGKRKCRNMQPVQYDVQIAIYLETACITSHYNNRSIC